jgi:hypothetical protein
MFADLLVTSVDVLAKLWGGLALVTDSNRQRQPFQGRLPNRGSGLKSTDLVDCNELTPAAL